MNKPISDVLSLEYHGPKVDLGRMDSYQAAAFIIAFSDYLGVVTKNTFGEKVELRTEIQGIRGESFDLDFWFFIAGQTATLLGPPLTLKDYFEIIKETIRVWIHLRGEAPKEIVPQNDNRVKIENRDGQIIYVNGNVINIISDSKAGKAAEKFISEPLVAGLSYLAIKSDTLADAAKVEQKDAPYFKPVDIQKPLISADVKMALQIESPTFVEGNKWRFFDGQDRWAADIQHEDFLARVNQGIERFGKGDTLIAIVRLSQSTSMNTLKMERSVMKVLDHVIAPQQGNLIK